MKAFRCLVCGEVYLGQATASNCPFCGAPRKFLVPAEEWEPLATHPLSPETLGHLERALELEISNSRFYRDAAARTRDPVGKSVFKSLSRIEAEHASVIRKLLNIAPDDLPDIHETASDIFEENLEESERREKRAIDFYRYMARNAAERGVRRLFAALVVVERDHLLYSRAKSRELDRTSRAGDS